MKKNIKNLLNINHLKHLSLVLLLISGFQTSMIAQYTSGQVIEKIISKVDNEVVLLSELESANLQYKQSGNPITPNLKCKILETLVINKLLVAKAKIDSVSVDDAMVENQLNYRIESVLNQYGGDEKQLEESYGKTLPQIKDEIRPQMKEQMLIQQMQQKITSGVKLTPADIKDFYNNIPKDSIPFISTEVEVAQIVLYPKPNQTEEFRVVDQLSDLKKRIEDGEDFCQLASIYSEDPGSKQFCGRLGYRKRGDLVPEFEAAALSMEIGEISPPVKTQFGYHIIQLLDRRGNEYASQHILMTLKTNTDDLSVSINKLDSIRNVILESDSLTFEMLAFDFNEDKQSKALGNRLTDDQGNTNISADNLDHNIYFTIDGLQKGEISTPLKFLSRDQKVGARLLYLISKKAPHVANLKDDYQKITTAATEKKKADELQAWFKKTLPEVYIYLDPEFDKCDVLKID